MSKASVIICTRNRPELLVERSLPSALKQGFGEVLVVENPAEAIYPKLNVRHIKNKVDIGLAGSKKKAIGRTNGKYVVFLDDDNELHPDFLKKTISYLRKHPEVDAVGVGRNIIYPEGTVYHLPKLPCAINDGFLIRRKVFSKIMFDPNLTANEDADFGTEFFKHFKMGLIDEPLMTVYGSPIINNTSYSDYSDYHLDGLCRFWLKHRHPDYKKMIGRMFLLSAGRPKWFQWLYFLEEKIKRYYQIWLSPRHR